MTYAPPARVWSATTPRPSRAPKDPDGNAAFPDKVLAYHSFKAFMRLLKDDEGEPLLVPWHIEDWCDLFQFNRLVALLAARDHGKTYTVLAYMAWRMWKHNRDPDTGELIPGRPEGNLQLVYFSSIQPQAIQRVGLLQDFLLDNEDLFGDLLPDAALGAQFTGATREVWSKTHFRLKNGAEVYAKSVGSATRGLHPDVVVADDVVENKNSNTELLRQRVWDFVYGTVLPMTGREGQFLFIGTPQHRTDALHRSQSIEHIEWRKYKAVDFDSGIVLWPARYDLEYLTGLQRTDPLLFSREYQMEPRDDASSIFPYTLTAKAVELGLPHRWVRPYPMGERATGDIIVGGGDLALSESAAADYTVYHVAVWNYLTQKRRTLWVERHRGLTFDQQVTILRDLVRDMQVQVMVVEQNNFQKWLLQHLRRYPETASRVFGHTTGVEKATMEEGIPGMKLVLENGLWEWPTQPQAAADFVTTMRSELSAFGWSNGKLGGVGEHDDTVTALYLVERAIRIAGEYLPATKDIITAEEVGIEPVTIGDDI